MSLTPPAKSFNPRLPHQSDFRFVVIDPDKARAGILRMMGDIESQMCAYIPLKYRKWAQLFCNTKRAPEESVAGWKYNPR